MSASSRASKTHTSTSVPEAARRPRRLPGLPLFYYKETSKKNVRQPFDYNHKSNVDSTQRLTCIDGERFRKRERLCQPSDFQFVMRKGGRVNCEGLLTIFAARNDRRLGATCSRIGIVVSKKVHKHAVKRSVCPFVEGNILPARAGNWRHPSRRAFSVVTDAARRDLLPALRPCDDPCTTQCGLRPCRGEYNQLYWSNSGVCCSILALTLFSFRICLIQKPHQALAPGHFQVRRADPFPDHYELAGGASSPHVIASTLYTLEDPRDGVQMRTGRHS